MTYENAAEAAEFIRSKYSRTVETVVVLGSGLGAFADEVENAVHLPYESIPHFARSTVEGHAGRLVLGEIEGVPVAVQQGRFHYYEGHDMEQVIFPMRAFGRLGVKNVILTNAAGSLNTDMTPGSLMLISDHLNCMGVSPLRGRNDERFGPRFPDMTAVYDNEFQQFIVEEANAISRERLDKGRDEELTDFLHRGVYCALFGPTYKTPAKIVCTDCSVRNAWGCPRCPKQSRQGTRAWAWGGIPCITHFETSLSGAKK